MPAAATVRPTDLFTPAQWAGLNQRSDGRGLGQVAHCWAVILGAMLAFTLWPNPLTWLLGVMIVGGRQLGLAILMHEAAHRLLCRNPALNDRVGTWACAVPVGADLASYRRYHFAHHRFTQQTEDPDLGLSAAYPVSRASLRRKIIRDLTGQTFLKQRGAALIAALKGLARAGREMELGGSAPAAFWRFAGFNLLFGLGCFAADAGLAFALIWLLAMATWFPLAIRLRNIAEHACVPDNDDPFRHARTVAASWIERALIAPYHVHYHAEHHLFAQLPCYRLARAHELLIANGHGEKLEQKNGYAAVLRHVTLPA